MQQGQKSDTGKTFDDYRFIIQQLKLRVSAITSENEQLKVNIQNLKAQQLVGNQFSQNLQQLPANLDQSFDFNKSDILMKHFKQQTSLLGLTLEALFRAADSKGNNQISLEEFRLFLSGVKLGLNQSHIERILYIIDENVSGVITQEQYYSVLQAYGVNSEIQESNSQERQKFAIDFAKKLLLKNLNEEKSYASIDKTGKGYFSAEEFQAFYATIDRSANKTKQIAVFHYFDFSKKNQVKKSDFITALSKINEKVLYQKPSQPSPKKLQFADQQEKDDNSKVNELLKPRQQRIQENDEQSKVNQLLQKQQSPVQPSGYKKGKLQHLAKKFKEQFKKPFTRVAQNLLRSCSDPERGVLLKDVITVLDNYKKNFFTLQEKFQLFKELDNADENGVVFVDELKQFVQMYWDSDSDYYFYVICLAKELQRKKQGTIEFFKQQNLISYKQNLRSSNSIFQSIQEELDEQTFVQAGPKIFQISQQDCRQLFNRLCQMCNNQSFPAKYLIYQIQQLRNDEQAVNDQFVEEFASPGLQSTVALNMTKNRSQVRSPTKLRKTTINRKSQKLKTFKQTMTNQLSDNQITTAHETEFARVLNKIKPSINQQDYFTWDNQTWKTIFTDQMACLKFCWDQAQQLKNKGNWVDPEFGESSTDPDQNCLSLYFSENQIPFEIGAPDPSAFEWKSMKDIYSEDPDQQKKVCFLEFEQGGDAASANEVQQGAIGNCWFISALSIIATKEQYVIGSYDPLANHDKPITNEHIEQMSMGVYPQIFHHFAKYGMYVLKFHKNYKPVYVVIDDRLPKLKDQIELHYGKCKPDEKTGEPLSNEYWVPLIEKAYAKLHNCYQALTSGFIDDALSDLTGLATEKRFISQKQLQTEEQRDFMWNLFKNWADTGSMIGCSVSGGVERFVIYKGENSGIYSGHAYAVLNVFEIPRKNPSSKDKRPVHRLFRIRNPHGFGEWTGKWSDNDEKMQDYEQELKAYFDEQISQKKCEEEFIPFEDDGTFIMCYQDVRNIFTNFFIGIDFEPKWNGLRCRDRWTENTNGGFPMQKTQEEYEQYSRNNQYLINVKQNNTQIFISCGQDDGRLYRGVKYPYAEELYPFNLCFFKLEPGQERLEKFDMKKLIQHSGALKTQKEICLPTFEVEAGTYVAVPTTRDADMIDKDFTMNFYSDCDASQIQISKVDDPSMTFEAIAEEDDIINDYNQDYKNLFDLSKKYCLNNVLS